MRGEEGTSGGWLAGPLIGAIGVLAIWGEVLQEVGLLAAPIEPWGEGLWELTDPW